MRSIDCCTSVEEIEERLLREQTPYDRKHGIKALIPILIMEKDTIRAYLVPKTDHTRTLTLAINLSRKASTWVLLRPYEEQLEALPLIHFFYRNLNAQNKEAKSCP